MGAVSQEQAGVASGVNNAVSRMAGLLAVAVFGLAMYGVFNRTLDRRLRTLHLSPAEIQSVNAQRPKLAGMESNDPRVMTEVGESFIFGYRTILWLAVVLALSSAVTARVWLDPRKEN
jgi:hypothetical protein